MNKGPGLLLLTLVICLAGGTLCFVLATRHTRAAAHSREAELEWLRQEYRLDDGQFAAIRDLHHLYTPRSEQMYRQIVRTDEQTGRLISANAALTPEVAAALTERARLHEECTRAALAHVYAVAGHMAPREGARYIADMKLQILEPGAVHHAAPNWPR